MRKRESAPEVEAKQECISPLYPESPSEQARAVVQRPEFQEALHYRLTEALYNNRSVPEILFANFPGKLPTFDRYINADVFAEEEAIEIDRFVCSYVQQSNPASKDVHDTIYETLKSGTLRPAPHEQINREEKWRRHLLAFAVAFRQRDFERTAELARELSNATKEKDAEMVADHFRGIIIPLLDSAIQTSFVRNDFLAIIKTLHITSICTFIPSRQFASTAELIMKDPAARAKLGREFLFHISLPGYDTLMRKWEGMGVAKDAIHAPIHSAIPDYMGECQKEKGEKFMFADELLALRERDLITNEEYRSAGQDVVIQGLVDSIGNRADWVKFFSDTEKFATNKDFFSPEELRADLAIRTAAQKYLEESFVVGSDPTHLAKAIGEVVLAKIMTRDEIATLPSLLLLAETFLTRVSLNNGLPTSAAPSDLERAYIATVNKYIETGLGTRTYFDNVPAIKKARAEAEQKINQKDS